MNVIAKGIDVSKHQGVIDWDAVKASGINYAIIRCGYGTDLASQDDPQFARNIAECERIGMPYGVYLYSYATTVAKAQSEAQHVLRLIAGHRLSYPVYYDLEDAKTTGKIANAKIAELAKVFCDAIEAAGYWVGIYANKYWFTNKLTDPVFNNWVKWVAQYNTTCTYTGTYGMWQYSSKGSVPGIAGNCDMNECYVDYPEAIHPTNTQSPVVAPPAPIKLSNEEVAKKVLNGEYGNGASRKNKLEAEGYDYIAIQAIVNQMYRKPVEKRIAVAGDAVKLSGTPLFASATTKNASSKKTGTYYFYDNEVINGRRRITNAPNRCGKKPSWLYVTGFINV